MKILITGPIGFVGSQLIPLLQKAGHEVHGLEGDLLNFANLSTQVRAFVPDCVVHLASISDVKTCEEDPRLAFEVNALGTQLLVEALGSKSQAHIVFATTSHVYDFSKIGQGQMLTESSALRPLNVYGRSKRAGELVLEEWIARASQARATLLRLFNFTHRTQSDRFFMPAMFKQLSEATGSRVVLQAGNLDVSRDIGSIDEVLEAFALEVQHSQMPGNQRLEIFNVATGVPKNLRRLTLELGRAMGKEVEIQVDPSKVRKDDPAFVAGDSQKFRQSRGWKPQSTSEATLVQMFLKN